MSLIVKLLLVGLVMTLATAVPAPPKTSDVTDEKGPLSPLPATAEGDDLNTANTFGFGFYGYPYGGYYGGLYGGLGYNYGLGYRGYGWGYPRYYW